MRWLFHALPSAVARQALGDERYVAESLSREGFVHCSFRDVLLASVQAYMADVEVTVLQIDPRRLDVPVVVVETPRGPMPHVHGTIPRDAVAATFSLAEFARLEPSLPDRVTGTRFGFLAFEGMTLLDLVGAYDPIARIASMGFDRSASCEIFLAEDGRGANRAWDEGGAELVTRRARPPLAEFDVVVVPGGPGTRTLERDRSLAAWLRSFPPNRLIASVCTGALLVGAAGRLRGKRATTHRSALERLPEYGATAVRERVVDEGQVVTAGGVTSGIDLGLAIVKRLEGQEVADKIATQMEWQG